MEENKREIKRPGITQEKINALASLAKHKKEGGKRTQDLHFDSKEILATVSEEQYQETKKQRMEEDFIIDDDGNGYNDDGGEIWEGQEEAQSHKQKNKEKNTVLGLLKNKKANTVAAPTQKPILNSKDILDQLIKDEGNYQGDVAFNEEEEYAQKFAAPILITPAKEVITKESPAKIKEASSSTSKRKNNEINKTNSDAKSLEPAAKKMIISEIKREVIPTPSPPVVDEFEASEAQYRASVEKSSAKKISDLIESDQPLTMEADGSLKMYLLDIAEDKSNNSNLYLIGKAYHQSLKKYMSCCVLLTKLERVLYAYPKKKEDNSYFSLNEIKEEVDQARKKMSIPRFKLKNTTRNYAFEMNIPHRKNEVVKIVYGANYPSLFKIGKTYDYLFGTDQTMVERLILKKRLMGPCWINVKSPKPILDKKASWCRYEYMVEGMSSIILKQDNANFECPPLSVLSFAMKTWKNSKGINEISMLSCSFIQDLNIDKPSIVTRKQYLTINFVRNLDEKTAVPFDFKQEAQSQRVVVQATKNEYDLINSFIDKIHQIDPDFLVSHELNAYVATILFNRIESLKVSDWSRIGRIKKLMLPNLKTISTAVRIATIGRLQVDTFVSAKDLLRETTYTLTSLANTQLKKARKEWDPSRLPNFYVNPKLFIELVKHTEEDASIALDLMLHLEILPLTKQLTSIAGNLWFKSLLHQRAERNEMLLMHEFYNARYLFPDKVVIYKDENDEEDKVKSKKRKKAAYEGGLVLEPKPGLYDKFIVLLDFNSLYPSIIQEYNICFTTIARRATQDFKLSKINEDTEAEDVQVPPQDVAQGILPKVLENLVQKRRQVKQLMKDEKNAHVLQTYEIRQKALKLTANSIYGCLGFTNSRFYAKPLAALITKKGREILKKAVDIVSGDLNLEVVYGDTDSIMINTKMSKLQEALQCAKKLKEEINRKYKKLVIDIDAVFKCLLLLKKKKYAARKLKNPSREEDGDFIERKGIDMVRRDWCPLSKIVGNVVLEELLSGKPKEEIVTKIYGYIECLRKDIVKRPLSDFIITKQVTRSPEDYKDVRSLPHVQVALRMIQKGKSRIEIINHFIPFIICKFENKEKQSYAERAYHPDDVNTNKYMVDIDYYIEQQIMPPLVRLVQNINEIDVQHLAELIGLDKNKYRTTVQKEDFLKLTKSTYDEVLKPIKYNCIYCSSENEFHYAFDKVQVTCYGNYCGKCYKRIPLEYVQNIVTLYIREMVSDFNNRLFKCDNCVLDYPIGIPLKKCPFCMKEKDSILKDLSISQGVSQLATLYKCLVDCKLMPEDSGLHMQISQINYLINNMKINSASYKDIFKEVKTLLNR